MNRAGFSLIEVLIALVIVAIMGAVVALNLQGSADQARVTSTQAQINTLTDALKLFQAQQGRYPTENEGLEALVDAPVGLNNFPSGGYLDSSNVPTDAWERPFLYLVPGRNGERFEVVSYGADGLEGGEGVDADISSAD